MFKISAKHCHPDDTGYEKLQKYSLSLPLSELSPEDLGLPSEAQSEVSRGAHRQDVERQLDKHSLKTELEELEREPEVPSLNS